MKTICLITALAATLCAQAQEIHQWKAAFNVSDDSGSPVSGANVSVFYDVAPRDVSTDSGKITGLTDANGAFAASRTDKTVRLRFLVQKAGYYSTDIFDDFHGRFTPEHLNRDLTIMLKKIANPVAMYAKSVNLGMPVFDKLVGFDLTAGDWIAPYGKGAIADIIFTGHLDKRTEFDADYKLVISFPNTGDGIQEFYVPDAEKGSDLRSPHEAPPEGYQPQWVQTDNRKPGQLPETNQDPNRNYFLRIHTILNPDGRVKSALYGKIYGDFMQFRYYLNPTPNDRNIEFDPKQNLLKGLKSVEQVSTP